MIKGVIFDMDGVLVDNMKIHIEAFVEMGRRYNVTEAPQTDMSALNGRGNDDVMRALLPAEVIDKYGIEALSKEKEAIYRELFEATIAPTEGLVALLEQLSAEGIPCAVGSSGPKENVAFVLNRCGIEPYFKARISGDMVTKCKPDPEIFLTAASQLGVAPEECLVFEDAVSGIEAAQRAGMKVVALTTTHTAEQLLAKVTPDLVVPNFKGLTPAKLQQL